MTSSVVSVSEQGDLAIVCINNPPVNATSAAVRQGLMDACTQCEAGDYRAVIAYCAGKTFVAGGDISEFGKPAILPHLPDVYAAIEASRVPWIAAMHGNALGGGFELAMACAYRIAEKNTMFGQPEVNIGLIPGAAGSQRLPRLIGLEEALPILTEGKMIGAEKLHHLGGLHETFEGDALEAAMAFADNLQERPQPLSAIPAVTDKDGILKTAREKLEAKSRGEMASLHNLSALEWAATLPFSEGQPKERALHLELRDSAESRALRHVFFSSRDVGKVSAIKDASPLNIDKIAIVGGGLMGAGIAFACLQAGYKVTLIERDLDAAEAGKNRIYDLIAGGEKRGKLTPEKAEDARNRLSPTADYADASEADLAIEAVFEDLDVKRAVFQSLAATMREDAILATNTSYLDPVQIMEGVSNPARLIGMHFFSPAHIMKLLEIVKLPTTSADVLATAFQMGKKLRKVGVLSGICDGFIGNRILAAYRRQADYLMLDGALPQDIDSAMRAFGMPMGPYEMQDMAGLQIAWANRKRQAATRDPAERYVTIGDTLCEMERFGQRTGKGWYRYEEGNRTPRQDADVAAIIEKASAEAGIQRQTFSQSDIQNRILAAMINEGALIVEEGIAERDLDVDMVKINGYGFPKWRGGPMHYASEIGFDAVGEHFQAVQEQSPDSWRASKRLS